MKKKIVAVTIREGSPQTYIKGGINIHYPFSVVYEYKVEGEKFNRFHVKPIFTPHDILKEAQEEVDNLEDE